MKKEIDGLKEAISQLPEFREKLKGLEPKITDAVSEFVQEQEHATKRTKERLILEKQKELLGKAAKEIGTFRGFIQKDIQEEFERGVSLAGKNVGIFEKLKKETAAELKKIMNAFDSMEAAMAGIFSLVEQTSREIEEAHGQQEDVYRVLLEKSQEEKGREKERAALAKRCAELEEKESFMESRKKTMLEKEKERENMIRELSELRDRRYALRCEVSELINGRLSPMIRVRIEQYGGGDLYRDTLMEKMKGAGFKYTAVVDRIMETISPEELKAAVQRENQQLLIERLNIDTERAHRIILQLKDSPDIFEIEVVDLLDKPVIELKDGPKYKDSLSLSTGQKCTTILPILLLESENPLLIDQPEDNLDNAFVYETVVKSILEIKTRRQLIFITHNPNIPVLGEAERVFVMESSGKKGGVKHAGTVDETREDIETIMEGGREAFEMRRKRYGR